MTLPFYVSCTLESPLLYELPGDRFQVMTGGTVGPFVAGYQFLLVNAELASFLASLEVERVTYRPATIIDPRTGVEFKTHTRVVVQQFFQDRDLPDVPLSGYRILAFSDQYYFVSPGLKDALEARGFEYLRFSEGLSQFAGCAA
jgi:hypothetical protein